MADQQRDPERKPIRVPCSAGDGIDGSRVITPGDTDYEENYARARRDWRRFGIPMPYADTSEPRQ